MAQAEKRLEAMRANPKGDWTIEDLRVVCTGHGVNLLPPNGGSHYKVAHPSQRDILTVPRDRPIKPPYIRRFVEFIDAVKDSQP
jgi:hypothetical protein